MATPTLPALPRALSTQNQFEQLHLQRTHAAYSLVGVAQVALAFLNFGDISKAQNMLQKGLLEYELAAKKLDEFSQKSKPERKTS